MGIFSKLRNKKSGKKAATKPATKTTTTKKAPAKKSPAKKASTSKSSASAKKLQPQCAALTASGKQCANSARSGSKYCGSHKGYQPPARGKATAKGANTKPAVKGAKDTAASGRRPAGTKQCAAKTKAGSQCKRDAVKAGKYCASHKGYRA